MSCLIIMTGLKNDALFNYHDKSKMCVMNMTHRKVNSPEHLSYISMLSYEQNSFGCFLKKWNSDFFLKHPKSFFLYLSNQISLRGCFVLKTNGMISSITSYKDHWRSFFTSWDIKQQRTVFWRFCINTQLRACNLHPY